MKNYFFEGVQGPNMQIALQGLDELLRKKYAGSNFELFQILVNHEMMPGKIATGQPVVVCNVVAILVSKDELPVETKIELPELPFIKGGQA